MFDISINDAARICGGSLFCNKSTYNCDEYINSLTIDSRSANKGDLFVAYKGEKVDGHEYINAAFSNGAIAAITDRMLEDANGPVIIVDDVQCAVEKLIIEFRNHVTTPIVGVSGSVGKTTTKEMIASVLSQGKHINKTEKNLNNLLGVPISMSRIMKEHELSVIEMGISIPGEMDRLAEMVKPDYYVLTKIGHAHLEFLHDLDGVFNEKTAVIKHMKDTSTVVVNGDDPYLNSLKCSQNVIRYGTDANCECIAENISYNDGLSVSFNIKYLDRYIGVTINAFGRHLVYAALAAATVGFLMGCSDDDIVKGIESYEVVGRRGAITKSNSVILIDDCYNSNMDSCKASLQSMMDLKGRHVAIIGDFLEQGDLAVDQHHEVGEYAKSLGVELIIGVGKLGKNTSDISYETKEQLRDDLHKIIRKGDVVLVKASLGAHLENIAETIRQIASELEN